MPGRDLSDRAAASATAAETEEVWLVLITLDHPDLDEPLRVVNNLEAITSRGNEYVALPFELEEPGDGESGPSEARIRIDNVDRRIVQALRLISEPPDVTLEAILADDPDAPEYSISGLKLRQGNADAGVVQGTLYFEDLTVEPCAESMTPSRFPGLW